MCGANQWTGFYMITASVTKGLRQFLILAMIKKFYFIMVAKENTNSVRFYFSWYLLVNKNIITMISLWSNDLTCWADVIMRRVKSRKIIQSKLPVTKSNNSPQKSAFDNLWFSYLFIVKTGFGGCYERCTR